MTVAAVKNNQYYGTGRRKTSIARVFLRNGQGNIVVNNQPIDDYFSRSNSIMIAIQPLKVLALNDPNILKKFDLYITVKGGGNTGQAGAISLGLARALLDESEGNIKDVLRKHGLLTRDSRIVERKKVGHKKSRKSSQYSKR